MLILVCDLNIYISPISILILVGGQIQQFNPEPVLPPYNGRPEQVEKVLKTRFHDAMTKLQGKELDLLIVILPDNNGSLYGKHLDLC